MDTKVEGASIKFLDRFCEIEKQCFGKEAFTKQQIAYLLTDYNAIGLAANVNGEIAGFLIGRIDIVRNTAFGHVLTVDTAPLYRRRGIAQRLLSETETTLKKRLVKECRLEVREDNAPALNLYRKLGYREMGKLERYYGNMHGLYLRKTL